MYRALIRKNGLIVLLLSLYMFFQHNGYSAIVRYKDTESLHKINNNCHDHTYFLQACYIRGSDAML